MQKRHRKRVTIDRLRHKHALNAAITDGTAQVEGLHRTWLDQDQHRKAPREDPRRAMGNMIGNAVRFGAAGDALIAGEGLETVPVSDTLLLAHLSQLDLVTRVLLEKFI